MKSSEVIIMKKNFIKRLCMAALCLALAAILPRLFHMLPGGISRILSPLHIPVLLCGLSCGWYFGAVCGFISPLLSYFISGMPAAAMLPSMTVECTIYGLFAGLFICLICTKHRPLNLYISLISAMLIGRIAYGTVNYFFFGGESSLAPHIWLLGSITTKLPGTILHLVLVPLLYFALLKAKLITKPRLK